VECDVTTEDDFQKQLDENPGDWQTRLVFADWLQDRDDPRAEGYRALGTRRHIPDRITQSDGRVSLWIWWSENKNGVAYPSRSVCLPLDWASELDRDVCRPSKPHQFTNQERRQIEDAAALAFAKLSAERRAELLHVKTPA
jgi:uncharacterized protein (TIGR02996 family)